MTDHFQYPRSGLNNTAEYMASGLPWVSSSFLASGSTWEISFPFVTNDLYITSPGTSGTLALGFTYSGSRNTNRLVIGSTPEVLHIRCRTIYLTALSATSASILAGLTTISERSFPILTGSGADTNISSSTYDRRFSYDGLG